MRGEQTGPNRIRHDNRLVVQCRVTGNGGAQVRAAADGWMDLLAYTRIGRRWSGPPVQRVW